MKHFITLADLPDFDQTLKTAMDLKKNPTQWNTLGQGKTLGLLFFNPSLRTRLSTQKAAKNLGIHTMMMNFTNEGWSLEFEDGSLMNGSRSEHVKEAAAVISQYCDLIAIRAFASLSDKEKDEAEIVLRSFTQYATVPIINMESATAHPLQGLADAITLKEHPTVHQPKIVLSWAPHPKALPHAVANSFTQMMKYIDAEFVIAHPEGYALNPEITKGVKCTTHQKEALEGADFVYTKNWSSYDHYGQILKTDNQWMITPEKMLTTNNGKFMHCLPIRRNVVATDGVLDSPNSLVIQQAENRIYSAQAVLKQILENG